MTSGVRARDRPEHRRAQGRRLVRRADPERESGHIGIDLHDQWALVGQPATGDHVVDRDAVGLERLDDDPGPVRGRLDEGSVDLLRRGGQGHPDEQPVEGRVHQHGPVAIPPVERKESGFADSQAGGPLLQDGVDVAAGRPGVLEIVGWQSLLYEPREVIADARLAGLVAEQARDDPILHASAHAGHDPLVRAEDHVAGRGPHDHHHPPGLGDGRGGNGDVGIDVGHRHSRSCRQSGPGGGLRG